jgi:hypothetical protein
MHSKVPAGVLRVSFLETTLLSYTDEVFKIPSTTKLSWPPQEILSGIGLGM